MFIDKAKIVVKGGKGGNGCRSFYQDRTTRYGKADGGDGGNGGNVILKASKNVFTLLDFSYRHEFTASNGKHGSSSRKRGKDGKDAIILVPLGTQIIDNHTGCLFDDLLQEEQEIIIAQGGKGGRGNHTKKEPLPGKDGESRDLLLDLKLIADVGIVGFPNAGKSTLISSLSKAKPKIASYPFTTKDPVLGVVETDQRSFTLADIPGLIEGAHRGKGLGDKFLRHVERTKILIHLIDMAAVDGRDPIQDYVAINKELELYTEDFRKRPQIVVANKMDCENAKDNLGRFKITIKKKIIAISAKEKENLEILVDEIAKKL